MLFSVDCWKLLQPSISFHKRAWSTLSTQCVPSVEQAFMKANTYCMTAFTHY